MPSGGKRPGAGRKKYKSTLAKEKAREYLIQRVVTELEPIASAQIESAKGMWIEEVDENGERKKLYRKLPDLKAGEYLIDQTIGKSPQTLDVKGEITKKIIATDE